MIKKYKQYINEDIKSKKISIGLKYDNLKSIYSKIQLKYNDDLKIVISAGELYLNKEFYKLLDKDHINKDDIIFEDCVRIYLFDMNEFTKISDYGEFGKGIKDFSCVHCTNLTNLDGAPEKIGGNFNCNLCTNLTSLLGAPNNVTGKFSCFGCIKLTNLEGVPKEIGGNFECGNCNPDFIELAIAKYRSKVRS